MSYWTSFCDIYTVFHKKNYPLLIRSLLSLRVKFFLKMVNICRSYLWAIKYGSFLWKRCILNYKLSALCGDSNWRCRATSSAWIHIGSGKDCSSWVLQYTDTHPHSYTNTHTHHDKFVAILAQPHTTLSVPCRAVPVIIHLVCYLVIRFKTVVFCTVQIL